MELKTLRGSISAVATDDSVVTLTATATSWSTDSVLARERLRQFEYRRTLVDGRLRVRFNVPDTDSGKVDLVVRVPTGVDLELVAGYGDIHAAGFRNPLDLRTVKGVIIVESHQASLRADAAMGRIECAIDDIGSGDTIRLETVDGSVRLSLLPGVLARLDAETHSGQVRIERLRYESETWTEQKVVAKVGNGNAGLGEALIVVRNVAGDIVLSGR